MPGGDRTGPMGMGRMSGRGAGFCAGFDTPGFMNAGYGRARGVGRGRKLPLLIAALPIAAIAYFLSRQNKSKTK